MIAGYFLYLGIELIWVGFRLLNTEDVWRLFDKPFKIALAMHCSNTVDVPRDDVHE
jgi:hypothetical protein